MDITLESSNLYVATPTLFSDHIHVFPRSANMTGRTDSAGQQRYAETLHARWSYSVLSQTHSRATRTRYRLRTPSSKRLLGVIYETQGRQNGQII